MSAGMADWVRRQDDCFEIATANYGVRLYRRDPKRLVTVFASAGARKVDGFAEEFRSSLWSAETSLLFVTDRNTQWFNYPESEALFERLAAVAGDFRHHGTVGESMGASGAILFTNFASNIDRVIAFAPQYSVLPPFVRFDARYDYIGEAITFPVYEDFSRSPIKSRVALITGNTVWRDHLHASMFTAAGFERLVVDGAPHEVAGHLKTAYDFNALAMLMYIFTDFGTDFTPALLLERLPVPWTAEALQPAHRFAVELSRLGAFNRLVSNPRPLPPADAPLVSTGRPALQSSVSEWSASTDASEDAGGAVNGRIGTGFQFHTALEFAPWWQVDLEASFGVVEIRLFNRIDNFYPAARASAFRILVSPDAERWQCVADRSLDMPFGGADGRPFILRLDPPVPGRFVRVALNGSACLHLNQVQVFGHAVT